MIWSCPFVCACVRASVPGRRHFPTCLSSTSCSISFHLLYFCPRDAMLARALAVAQCPLACVCHKSVFYRNGWTNRAGFGHGSFFPTVLHCKEIQVPPGKIRVLPSGTLLQTPDLENIATAYRSSKRAIDLARERWTLRA